MSCPRAKTLVMIQDYIPVEHYSIPMHSPGKRRKSSLLNLIMVDKFRDHVSL